VTSPRSFFHSASVFRRITPLFFGLLLVCCGHAQKSADPLVKAAPTPFPDPAPRSREADDAARFLAGLPGKEGSSFADLEKEEAWQTYQAELDRMWSMMETRELNAMREFQVKELNRESIRRSLLFYPFSGPDALMMNVFFPHNSTYVMVGLEPPGTLPIAVQFEKKKNLAALLDAERNTLNDVLGRSFFITQYMDRQFRGQVTDGLFQPIIHLLVRTNHTILGYRYVRIDENGKVVDRDPAIVKIPNRGVEVDFEDANKKVQRLFYFSTNINDDHLADNKGFTEFVSQLKGMTTYFKATSYMTHRPDFSIIRNLVLTNSNTVLQDDSGLPYHLYTDPPWRVQLFGNYNKPIRPFGWLEQKDLRVAYQTMNPKPLNFHIGYGLAQLPSNLLLATKSDRPAEARAEMKEQASARN
jgi:hypothetical protein